MTATGGKDSKASEKVPAPFSCPKEGHKHGLTTTCHTSHSCRCRDCRDNAARVNRVRYREKAYGTYKPVWIDATGTHRRLQALAHLGWSLEAVGARLGTDRRSLQRTLRNRRTAVTRAAAVVVLYDELWNQPPPLETREQRLSAARARGWARRSKFQPALAWDDDTIDRIDATPDLGAEGGFMERDDHAVILQAINGRRPQMSPIEKREVVTVLTLKGWSATRIEEWAGIKSKTVERIRAELGLEASNVNQFGERAA